jgi:hypothetical protein
MKNKKLFVISLLLLSLMLAACGSAATKSAPTNVPTATLQPTEAPTQPEVNFPTGKFLKSSSMSHGLIFNTDGTFSVFEASTTIVNGKYSVDGDIFTDESNSQGCPPLSFKYTFDGTNLTFSYVSNPADDPCDGRRSDFNNQTYILSK